MFAVAVVTVQSASVTQAAADCPNVVLIMADDLSYHDLSCYGSRKMRTPELDRLASEGVRLTTF